MSVEQKGDTMTEGRGLLTEREREAIEGESSDSYRYKTRTYVRKRLDKLEADAELLAKHEPDLYDRLLDAVGAPAVDAPEAEPVDEPTAPADGADTPADDATLDDTRALVDRVVDAVAESWEEDNRLDDRKAAAAAVLTDAVTSGGYIGQSDAIERFHDEYAVDGQGPKTWWKRNAREVLSAVGTYSRGKGGYAVSDEDLRAYLD